MLEDSECGLAGEVIDELNCSVYVKQVVVRNLLAMNLLEHIVEVAVESALLVWVLAVAQ